MLVTRFPGCVGDENDCSGWRQQCWLGPVTLPPQRLPGLTSAKATGATKAATLDNTRGNTGLTQLTHLAAGDYMSLGEIKLLTTAAERPRSIFIAETKTGG